MTFITAQEDLLGQAVEAYRAALEVYTMQAKSIDWATTQNNLGNVLHIQALLAEGVARARLLEQAMEVYQAALEVYKRQTTPAEWAMTQFNLGNVLSDQAELAKGAVRTRLLDQAVKVYRAVLEVYTRQKAPERWAMTQGSLALLHLDRASLLVEEDKEVAVQALREAHECVTSSLEIYTREAMPADHQEAIQLREEIEAKMRSLSSEPGEHGRDTRSTR